MQESIHRVVCLVVVYLTTVIFTEAQILPGNIVDTQYGQILGNRRIFNGQLYEEYLAIPYAAPPVDELRWQKPQPAEPWEGVLNGTAFSIHCTQRIAQLYPFIGIGSESGEDCLYLNVWVPGGVDLIDEPLPVMVFIYGGGYDYGTGEMYPGHGLALHGNVIFVNFNYRVNVMGWLSTEDSALPGNYGLWDTKLALTWISNNIESFEGDPDRITIFGQSAGARITVHSMLSSQMNTLFQNAAAISGAASAPESGITTPSLSLRTAVALATVMNCTFSNTEEIASCLREKDPHDLDNWGRIVKIGLGPVIDGDIIARHPRESFQNGEGKHINFITGHAYVDSAGHVTGNTIALPLLGDERNNAATNESLYEYLRNRYRGTSNPDEVIRSIVEMYPDMDTTDNYTRTLAATRQQTDAQYGTWGNWEAIQHVNANGTGKTFRYLFHHRQSFLIGYPDWINGSHVDDLYSILGTPFMQIYRRIYLGEDYDELDNQIMENIMNYYSNFAHTGDPNIGPYPTVIDWQEFDPLRQNFLRQSPEFQTGSYFEENMVDRYRYWTDVFPSIPKYPPPPTLPSLADIPRPTEEEIQNGVERLRRYLYELI